MKTIAYFLLFTVLEACLATFCVAGMPVKSAILMNLDNGQILYKKNPAMPIPPASLTKIMTMFLTLDAVKAKKISLNQKVRIDKQAAQAGGSSMHLSAGESVPVVRLLAGAAVSSGNDAARALAKRVGGTEANFVKMMNKKAKALGMANTTFKNPTGLPAAGQKTTATDLLMLCRAYLKTHPQAERFHSMTFFMHKGRVSRNTNPLLGTMPGVNGLKTGWTIASGYNLIVTAKRGNTRLLAIILGGPTKNARDSLARQLIDYGFRYPQNSKRIKAALNHY